MYKAKLSVKFVISLISSYKKLLHKLRLLLQRLLLPVPVELDPVASSLLTDGRKFLLAHGLEVAEFGRNFFRIEAVPSWMEPSDAEGFLRDVLGAMREGRLPVERGLKLDKDDLVRRDAIMALMCQGRVDFAQIERAYPGIEMHRHFAAELVRLEDMAAQGLVKG